MPSHEEIYQQHGPLYDALVSREDHSGNLGQALRLITPMTELEVAELGAGTGRLTMMIAAEARWVHAFDASAHMLEIAADKLTQAGFTNWQTAVADHHRLPLSDRAVDAAVSGWSICYAVRSGTRGWEERLAIVVDEMQRITRPGGTLIIIETLGTGFEAPQPPPELLPYLTALQQEHAFSSMWIRTDYLFHSLKEAIELTGFFFGEELAAQVAAMKRTVLPECTAVYWRRVK